MPFSGVTNGQTADFGGGAGKGSLEDASRHGPRNGLSTAKRVAATLRL